MATTVTLTQNVPADLAAKLGLAASDDDAGDVLSLPDTHAQTLVRQGLARFGTAAGDATQSTTGSLRNFRKTATLDFPSIAAAGAAVLTIPVPGAALNDPVVLGPPASLPAGCIPVGFVSAAGVVSVRVENNTAAAIDPPSAQWRVAVINYG